jgi:mannose-1-phosphate guanylyltransferase/mannose-6-phosphate isomerase
MGNPISVISLSVLGVLAAGAPLATAQDSGGLQDVVVVETADAVLVASKAHSQDVKHIVSQLSAQKREEHSLHRKVHRPWGWYDSIDEGGRFKVKRIQVKPGASLSLQKHHHRAEHWIVVKGTAEVVNGEQVLTLHENESTYIPIGQKHRLTNKGTEPLEIIEVQSGSYLGEDDIVRFEDTFGRVPLVQGESAHCLAKLAGTEPQLADPPRQRPAT